VGREENVEVFKDTERLCNEHVALKEAIKSSITEQKLIKQDVKLQVEKQVYTEPAKVIVSKKRSYEAAEAYKGQKVGVHNFASATNPGGGVTRGSSAQEECLCRCSNLYFCLNTPEMWDGFYRPHRKERNSLHNDDIIYTPDVVVFKSDTSHPELMPENKWYKVNVLTCAAPNLRPKPSNDYNPDDGIAVKITDKELLALQEKRLGKVLDVAVMEGNEVVILGAFGCGAFDNNPDIVARAAANVVKEYRFAFKTIEFAVYCSAWDKRNFETFERVMKGIK